MRKPLSQIAFDFGAAPEPEENQESSTHSARSPKPPARVMEEEPVFTPTPSVQEEEPVLTLHTEEDIEREEEELILITNTEEEVYFSQDTVQTAKRTSTRGRKSLRENAVKAEMIEIPNDEDLFKKSYYAIGEVAKMFNENQSLIRYWESEFDILKPRKNKKGDRYFRPVDVKNLVLIHDLLRRRKFTIEGAKEYLKKNKRAEEKFALIQSLEKMKSFFLELKAAL